MILRYIILYVDDVSDAMAFFERAFALERGFLHEAGDYGELVTGTTKLAFSSIALMQQLGKEPQPGSAAHPSFEIAFETDDVAAAVERALAAGAPLVQAVREEAWGQTTAYVSDPSGRYLIELCSPVQVPSPG